MTHISKVMAKSINMVVTDLDGTLLKNDKTISAYSISVLDQIRKSGVKVVYATGRGGSAEQVAPEELFDGRITMNGAIAKISDSTVYGRLIPFQTARPILVSCNRRGMRITSEISGMHYSNFNVSDLWQYITNFQMVDFSLHEMDAEKIYTPNPTPDDIAFINRILPNELYFVVTGDVNGFLGQIMHKDATKGQAVSALANHWGISLSEVVAFGDDFNDIEMLKKCAIGVAVENAIEEVRTVADFICDTNDNDGVAKWLEERMLT